MQIYIREVVRTWLGRYPDTHVDKPDILTMFSFITFMVAVSVYSDV